MTFSQAQVERLALEIETRNAVNIKLNCAGETLRSFLASKVGTKIRTAENKFTKKMAEAIREVLTECGLFFDESNRRYNDEFKFYVPFESGGSTLYLNVEKVYSYGNRVGYVKGYTYLGDVGYSGILESVPSAESTAARKCDYSLERIVASLNEIDELKKKISEVEHEIYEFRHYFP